VQVLEVGVGEGGGVGASRGARRRGRGQQVGDGALGVGAATLAALAGALVAATGGGAERFGVVEPIVVTVRQGGSSGRLGS